MKRSAPESRGEDDGRAAKRPPPSHADPSSAAAAARSDDEPPPAGSSPRHLGGAARKARREDGSTAALELGIDTDDELEPDELLAAEGSDDFGGGAANDAGDGSHAAGLVPQEALIRRRLGRMRELHALYEAQYWRLLEDLRRMHYRFTMRNGHGGRKEEAAAAAQERDRAGLPATCACGGCDARPMPLSHYCFAHILMDPKQMLYAAADGSEGGAGDAAGEGRATMPVMCTEEPAQNPAAVAAV